MMVMMHMVWVCCSLAPKQRFQVNKVPLWMPADAAPTTSLVLALPVCGDSLQLGLTEAFSRSFAAPWTQPGSLQKPHP